MANRLGDSLALPVRQQKFDVFRSVLHPPFVGSEKAAHVHVHEHVNVHVNVGENRD
jgi:hypothetical protein